MTNSFHIALFQHRKACTKPGVNRESNLDQVITNSDGNSSDFPQTSQSQKEQHSRRALQQERNSPEGEGPSRAREPKRNHGAALCVATALTAVQQLDLTGEGEPVSIHPPPRCIPICCHPGSIFASLKMTYLETYKKN